LFCLSCFAKYVFHIRRFGMYCHHSGSIEIGWGTYKHYIVCCFVSRASPRMFSIFDVSACIVTIDLSKWGMRYIQTSLILFIVSSLVLRDMFFNFDVSAYILVSIHPPKSDISYIQSILLCCFHFRAFRYNFPQSDTTQHNAIPPPPLCFSDFDHGLLLI
jgi:hypothetical protein